MRPDRGVAPAAPRAPLAGGYGACVSAAGAGEGAGVETVNRVGCGLAAVGEKLSSTASVS